MLTSKRIDGDYSIVSTSGGTIILDSGLVTLTGDLTVQGTTTTVNSTVVTIADNIIILNSGEVAAGVGGGTGTSGIEVERGSLQNSFIVWDETNTVWTIDQGDGNLLEIATTSGGAFMSNLIDDTTPQVGGSVGLDMRGNSLTNLTDLGSGLDILLPLANANDITLNASNAASNIVLTASGANGEIILASPVLLQGGAPSTTPASNEAALFKGADTNGGTQIHYENDTTTGELVSKTKAIMYSIIF